MDLKSGYHRFGDRARKNPDNAFYQTVNKGDLPARDKEGF
jgi:hypothetical protein